MALTKVSGSVLKNPLSLSGNVSVGGTLTYEDVTNVDAIGIITARSDISIADKIIHTGDTNTAIRFPAADTFAVETGGLERFRVDASGDVLFGTTDDTLYNNSSGEGIALRGGDCIDINRTSDSMLNLNRLGSDGQYINFRRDGSVKAALSSRDNTFCIDTGSPTVERLRVDTNGDVLIGTTDDTVYNNSSGEGVVIRGGDCIDIARSGDNQLFLNRQSSDGYHIAFIRDGSYKSFIATRSNAFCIDVNGSERVRIDSSGRLGVGDDSPDRELVVKNASSNSTIKIEAKNTHTSQLFFSDTDAENVARIGVFHGSGQATSNGMLFETGGTARMMINSSGQLIVNTVTSTDAIFTVSSPNHYVVTSSGKAHKHIHCRSVNGNSGEYGGAISFGMGSDGSSAIAAEQMGSSGNINGLAFFTHDTSTGSDDSVKRMRINHTGGIMLNNWASNRGFIFQRLGTGTYPDFPSVQQSQGRGMIDGQRVMAANTATEIARSHWGGLALIGYSNSQHQGTAQVMFGYGGAGTSVRFQGHWVRQESITISFTTSAYSLMMSHTASNDLSVWCILIGV
jgi:hypothetical protein